MFTPQKLRAGCIRVLGFNCTRPGFPCGKPYATITLTRNRNERVTGFSEHSGDMRYLSYPSWPQDSRTSTHRRLLESSLISHLAPRHFIDRILALTSGGIQMAVCIAQTARTLSILPSLSFPAILLRSLQHHIIVAGVVWLNVVQ